MSEPDKTEKKHDKIESIRYLFFKHYLNKVLKDLISDIEFKKVSPKCFEKPIIDALKRYLADPLPGDTVKQIWGAFTESLEKSIKEEYEKMIAELKLEKKLKNLDAEGKFFFNSKVELMESDETRKNNEKVMDFVENLRNLKNSLPLRNEELEDEIVGMIPEFEEAQQVLQRVLVISNETASKLRSGTPNFEEEIVQNEQQQSGSQEEKESSKKKEIEEDLDVFKESL